MGRLAVMALIMSTAYYSMYGVEAGTFLSYIGQRQTLTVFSINMGLEREPGSNVSSLMVAFPSFWRFLFSVIPC